MSLRLKRTIKRRTLAALRRLGASFVALTLVLSQLPILTAYEAHIINVTARLTPRCEDITITGVKFNDLNGNGTQEGGEAGLPQWIIELKVGPYELLFDYNGNGANDSNDYGVLEDVIVDGAACPAATRCDFNNDGSTALDSGDLPDFQNWLGSRDRGNQETDAQGRYEFTGLNFGDYVVTEVVQAGWTPTTEPRRAVTVTTCETTVNFGNQQREAERGSLSGHKWHDLNQDGTWQQPDEPPIAGWSITLGGDGVGAAVTNTAGEYGFTDLPAGNYTLTEETRSGWASSTPTVIAASLAEGEHRGNLDFGNYQTGVCENAITLDFELDASGHPILKGQFVDDEYAPWGIAVRAHNYNAGHPQVAIIFDSDAPSGGTNGDGIADVDLGTPNQLFGGPGDSENGDGTEPSNNRPLHNLLIIPDNVVDTTPADGYVDDPNDEPSGGSLRFIFDQPMAFSSVLYVDFERNLGEVVGYADASGTDQLFAIPVPHGNGNSVQKVTGDQTTPIRFLKLRSHDSFGIDEVVLCPLPPACGDGAINQETEQCDDGNTVDGDGCSATCQTTATCGNGVVEHDEQCDDGNLVNDDGCDNACAPTNWCGDGAVQTPNSFGQNEQCDDGALNGSEQSHCTLQCTPTAGECSALSIGYYRNNDGCPASSIWADEVSVLSDSFFDVFVTLDGPGFCQVVTISDCPSGGTVAGQLCRAKAHLLADEADVVSDRLRLDALLGGADDGNAAFDALGLTSTSTVSQAISAVEEVVADGSSTRDDLARAAYVAARIYNFYEEENPTRPECILPGFGNGVVEVGEQCDDGNLIPWDGCSPSGQQEIVLNEILPNPVGSDSADKPGGEWVELFNRSSQSISLEGWVLYDVNNSNELFITAGKTTVATTTIAAGGHLVVFRDGDSDFNLNNAGDSVRLFNDEISDGGALMDAFIWTTEKPEGNSYARVPDGTGDWVDPCPTPGEDNVETVCAGDGVNVFEALGLAVETEPAEITEPAADAAYFSDELWLVLFPEIIYATAPEPVPTPTPTPSASPSPSPTPMDSATPSDSPAPEETSSDVPPPEDEITPQLTTVSDSTEPMDLKSEEIIAEPQVEPTVTADDPPAPDPVAEPEA